VADSRQVVLDIIRDRGPIGLRDIERLTGLGHTTVGSLVAELRAQDAVVADEAPPSRRRSGTGRPPILVSLNPDLARLVGVQFEHTHIRAAVTDLSFRIRDESTRQLQVSRDADESLAVATEMVRALIGASGLPQSRFVGVAMALAAPIDQKDGTVRTTTALRDWVGRRPAEDLGRRLRLPVTIGNDATLAGFGEFVAGAANGSLHSVYVKLSATIGCGIVIDGVPYVGATGTAGELAHVVVDDRGELCYCGSRGCLNREISVYRILRDLESAHGSQLEDATRGKSLDECLEVIVDWAVRGDAACQRKLREIAGTVGLALVNLCNLVDPQTIVVGGVLSQAGDLLLEPLCERVHTATREVTPSPVVIVRPSLGEKAEVLGAAALVLRSGRPQFKLRLQKLIDDPGSGHKEADQRPPMRRN